MMKVPFLDLKEQYGNIKDEIAVALQEVLDNTAFAGGPISKRFEDDFATFNNAKYCIGCGSGTEALWLAFIGAGIGCDDEVIIPTHTFIATAEAVTFTGAKPVFVDIDETTFNMDPAKLEAAITPRTKAIVPVHLYGQMADMDEINKIAEKHNIMVIEDSAQGHDAKYKDKSPGELSKAACFSFYPGKNLGAYGEAGAVVTNDEEMANRMNCFRDHGQAKKYYHSMVGWNARLDGFQGAVLGVKLKYLPQWTESRRRNAAIYDEMLADVEGIKLPKQMEYAKHVYHLYVVRVANREDFMEELKKREVFTGIHYPIPVHLQEAYQDLGYSQGAFPVSEKVASEIVSLPMFPELKEEQVRHAIEHIKEVLSVTC